MRTESRRQEARHDPMTRRGRGLFKKSGTTRTKKRVRFAVPITPAEARDLLVRARRISEENASDRVPLLVDRSPPADRVVVLVETTRALQTASKTKAFSHMNDCLLYEEAEAAVTESLRPRWGVIQRLATRAVSEHDLRELMKVVASGDASPEQLREFQGRMDGIKESAHPEIDDGLRVDSAATQEKTPYAASDSSEPESETSDKENSRPASNQDPRSGDSSMTFRIYDDTVPETPRPRRPLGDLPVPGRPPRDQPSSSDELSPASEQSQLGPLAADAFAVLRHRAARHRPLTGSPLRHSITAEPPIHAATTTPATVLSLIHI